MDFSVDFFKDEVRNGFYIPTAIKQAWAANLCVLSEIDRICEKYGIMYFADWGSMLGAVRHGGYVPWDDDLDICMKRAEYDRFKEVADKELPKEFAIHDYRRKEDHWLFLSRVVNCNSICFDEEHLKKYHNFPYIAVVDIFVKDYLYRDEAREQERIRKIKHLIASADGIVDGSFKPDVEERILEDIEKNYNRRIERKATARDKGIEIYSIAEDLMACVPECEADNIGQMFPMVLGGDRGLPKEYYDEAVRIPFENTTIPVPARYNEMLGNRYGDYLIPKKIWNGHNYPYFEGQRENLKAVADFELPEFSFKKEMLEPCDRASTADESLKGMSLSVITQLRDMNGQLVDLFVGDDHVKVSELLPELQQFVVDYGTLVEEVRGDKDYHTLNVVAAIQNYCDILFGIYNYINDNEEESVDYDVQGKRKCTDNLAIQYKALIEAIDDNVIKRKEILFITTGTKEWYVFEELYHVYEADGQCDVFVMPVPMFFKDVFGRVTATVEDVRNAICYEDYPDNICIVSWMEYNIGMHRPDVIYIQNPYDGENPCLTVPLQFYASNIRKYTDMLIYIPPYITDEFSMNDYNDVYNTKHYVTAPGVIYADKIIVQSDNIKSIYKEVLVRFAGENTRQAWESKLQSEIVIDGKTIYPSAIRKCLPEDKKKLLYCIGLNELSEHTDYLAESVKNRIDIMSNAGDRIDVNIILFPDDKKLWDNVDSANSEKLLKVLSVFPIIHVSDYGEISKEYDAYYGSASPMVPFFSYGKKPVMIANYELR